MGLVGFSIRPHLGADYFPVEVDTAMMERAAAKLDHPLYAIDDETAIKVVDQEVEVVSEGEWRLFNGWRHRQRLGGRLDRAGGPGVSMKDGKDVRVIAVPYDSGHAGIRMGTGPKHLLDNGFGEALRSEGLELGVATVRHEGEPPAEVSTAFELHGLVSDRVREAVAGGGFPLVLSGNCNTAAIGAISGVGPEDLGIVWFDAHGEFNTPETTTSGFIDGMGLAIAVGHCWRRMAGEVPGFSPVPEENVVMAWVREVDPTERERLDASSVAVVDAGLIEREGTRELAGALDHLKARVGRVYVHLDLDVLDAGKVGKANEFASEGGPDAEELQAALGMVGERFEVVALGIASYDPSFDTEGKVLRAVTTSVGALTRLTDSSD
jgi:arginase